MKRLITLASILALLTLGLSNEESLHYFRQTQLIQEQAVQIQEMESKHKAEVLSLKEELAVSQGIVSAVTSLEHLESQISDLRQARERISASVSTISAATASASSELNRIRAATARIDTMTGAFTSDMGIVGCKRFPGVSMEPTFDYNSLVCISNHPSYLATVGIGDIVIGPAGCRADRHVIHRVVRKLGEAWVLKGDNPLNTEDPCALKPAAVFYKVVGIAKGIYW